jgi:hypothetical protein
VDLGEILYEDNDIEDDTDSIVINSVASTIPKWRTFELLRWAQLLNRLVDLGEILYEDNDIEDYTDSIVINPVASTIPKWWTLKLLWWVQLLN